MKKLCIIISCLACIFCLTAFIKNTAGNLSEDEKIIAMRGIGNKILLQSGDATSNLLPVKKLGDDVFQLRFQKAFTFIPDSLVKIISTSFIKAGISQLYLVKVINPLTNEMVYGYEVFNKADPENIPCLGRYQPVGLYYINISFGKALPINVIATSAIFPSIGMLLSLLSIALFMYYGKKAKPVDVAEPGKVLMGEYSFFIEQGILKHKDVNIHLTAKEIKLLRVFALQPNVVIERQELIKQIWEDEGLIVGGRSLDVFVSRLRKKLENDSSVNIINAHGLGYKLELNNFTAR